MSERIDHAAEARELIEGERKPSQGGWETADAQHLANLIEAQALATLGLVEQQRIANLQRERAMLWTRSGRRSGVESEQAASAAESADLEIREALGL